MPSSVVLIVVANPTKADRYADALMRAGQMAVVFARDPQTAIDYATAMRPDLAVIALDEPDGTAICRRLRFAPSMTDIRRVLVVERRALAAARESTANGVLVEPVSAERVASEAIVALRRLERRMLARPDRRHAFRGGRRLTDVAG